MGISIISSLVMVSVSSLVLMSCLICLTTASICMHGKEYLSTSLQRCVNCTVCKESDVVLSPCEIHRDTICGPVSEVFKYAQPSNPHRHKHHQRHRNRNNGGNDDLIWKYDNNNNHHEHNVEKLKELTSTEVPFSNAEELVWDWQAIALTCAVFACILFFLAITLYSLHQAKQWRRLKDNFDANVEELSAKLSLMAAASYEKGEILEPQLGPITDGNYLNNRCVYLEQLLNVRKDTKIGSVNGGGNVYIEESSASPATSGKT